MSVNGHSFLSQIFEDSAPDQNENEILVTSADQLGHKVAAYIDRMNDYLQNRSQINGGC
jgi:hypothetical protein